MTKAGVAISILIPTHGRPTLLGRTLASLAACSLPESYREAVVVENGSRGGAEAVVAEVAGAHPALQLRYMHVERANKSHALNEALQTVDDGLVIFFDDDVRLDPGVLEAYAEVAEDIVGGMFFGGPFGVDYERRPRKWVIPLFPRSARGMELDGSVAPAEYLGFNWAAYSGDLKRAGGFNPEYGPGSPTGSSGQESEMQRQLRKQGVQPCNVHTARVWHYVPVGRSSFRWLAKRLYRSGIQQGLTSGRMTMGKAAIKVVGNVGLYAGRFVKYGIKGDGTKMAEALLRLGSTIGFVKGQVELRRRA